MGKKNIVIKDWYEIQEDYLRATNMVCKPTNLRKMKPNEIIDEEKSVRWNKEEIEKNNKKYNDEVTRLNKEKNAARDRVLDDIYAKIQYEVGHNISKEKAKNIWDYTYNMSKSYGIKTLIHDLENVIGLAKDLLK